MRSKQKLFSIFLCVCCLFSALSVSLCVARIKSEENKGTSSFDEKTPETQSSLTSSLPLAPPTDEAGLTVITDTGSVFNILLIGTDARISGQPCRSDTMMLVSINRQSKKIVACSLLRDILVPIDGYGEHRLNSAYSFGGTSLLLKTLKDSLNIDISSYISVDFSSFAKIIDILGGVEVTVSSEEARVMNEMCKQSDSGISKIPLKDGTYHLNGIQALSYARDRSSPDGDFDRTKRQRNLISSVIKKIKKATPLELLNLLPIILQNVNTNLSESQFKALISELSEYLNYDSVFTAIPQQGTFSFTTLQGMSVIDVDFEANIRYLSEVIYS